MQSTVLERLRQRQQGTQAPATPGPDTNAHTNGGSPNRAVQAVQNAQTAVENAGQINPPGEAHEPLPPTETVDASAASEAVPALSEPVRRPRGRPRKNPVVSPVTTTAPPGGVVSTVTTSTPTPFPSTPVTDTAANAQAAGYIIGTLYVNCRPMRPVHSSEAMTESYELIAAAHKLVCEDQAVAHYKFIDYGRGAGALCVALGLVLEERGYIPCVCVTTRSAESLDVMQTLAERSAAIVVSV